MRILALVFGLVLLFGMLSLPAIAKTANSDDSNNNLTKSNGQHSAQNQTQEQVLNQTEKEDKNKTEEQNQARQQEQNQTQEQKNETKGNGKGISDQVQQIIEERKNGSITVPQGILVRIIAQNHTMTVEEAVVALNETITANVTVNGKNKTLKITPDKDKINITDGNVTVETNETLEIVNDTLTVDGAKVLIMPSEVPQKINAKTIKSAVLHVVNGDPLYQVNATKGAKVLWIFDADMDVETTLDASTGQVKNENKPWWSFLASTD